MKLIFIYGAPAVGKLTVANEIAEQTNFKVFHNHLSIDAIEPIFDFGTKPFARLIDLIRVETIAEAARENVDLIHTFCYAKDSDDKYVAKITKAVESNGGEICFVLLTCERDELEKRVLEESRKQFGKADNLEILNEILDKYDLSSPVPERRSLQIDNTNLSPAATARKIIKYYKLEHSERKITVDAK
jgi:broad-specificity NMP kinase